MTVNAFDWRNYDRQIDWSDMAKTKRLQEASTALVAKKRGDGIDPGAIKGMSDKGDSLVDDYHRQRRRESKKGNVLEEKP